MALPKPGVLRVGEVVWVQLGTRYDVKAGDACLLYDGQGYSDAFFFEFCNGIVINQLG